MPGIGTRFGTRGIRIGRHRCRSTTTAEFPAPTCVLKGSDDDVEDRRHDPCCASDGGRSSGVAVQAEIPNHRRLRRSRAGVVSAAGDVSLLAGQVCDEKTNMCEPLLTHRNETTMASKPGSVGGPGTKARCGGPSVGELPVCGPDGARCIGPRRRWHGTGEPVAPIETARVFGRERENRKQRTLRVGEYRCGAQGRTGP